MRAFLFSLLVLAVGACAADGVQVTRENVPHSGVNSHADYLRALGPVPVVTANAPFAGQDVVTALRRHDPRRIDFTAADPGSPPSGYRVLLAFNTNPPNAACRAAGPAAAGAPSPPPTTSVYGAFCLGPTLLSEAVATAPGIQSGTDPRLARLLGDLLAAIMPHRDPNETVLENN